MQASDIPAKFVLPFAANATASFIRLVPVTSSDPNAASLSLGFPPNTFTPIEAGGSPPDGRDENGILNPITAWNRWQAAGGAFPPYDATFQTGVSGYPQGAVIASAVTLGVFWLSTVDNNTTNPDSAGAGWVGGALFGSAPVIASLYGLVGSAPGSTVTASWTVDEIIAETALGGIAYKGSSLALAFNGAGTGAGGMDTGSVPTAADLNVYAIFNPATSTWSTLGTVTGHGAIYSGGHMPAGYTASVLIWAGVTSASKIVPFRQAGRQIFINANALVNGSATSPTSVSLTTIVPAATITVRGNCLVSNAAGAIQVAGTSPSFLGNQTVAGAAGTSGNYGDIPMATPQTLFYQVSVGTVQASIAIDAYTI